MDVRFDYTSSTKARNTEAFRSIFSAERKCDRYLKDYLGWRYYRQFLSVSTKCRLQTADCRLQTGYKMQTRYKMQTAGCRLGTKCRLTFETVFFLYYYRLSRNPFSDVIFHENSHYRGMILLHYPKRKR